ncbi:nucleoside phosphorylase [soil metagenome]
MPQPIAASELVLNNDGSVYHLNLHPENIGNTIITVGDPDRVGEVSKHFDRVDFKTAKREFVTHSGYIGSKRITVLSTGIGTDNIDIVFNELDALVNIDLKNREIKDELTSLNIIRIGTAGGLQPELGVDSVVLTEEAIGLAGLMPFYQRGVRHVSPLLVSLNSHLGLDGLCSPYAYEGSKKLLGMFGDEFVKGITVTCTGFYGPQGRQLRLAPAIDGFIHKLSSFRYEGRKVTNFEMETSGIYGLGSVLGHQCLSASLIVANRATGEFSAHHDKALERLIVQVLERVG